MTLRAQDPDDLLDWALDFASEFIASGDSVSAYAWTITPDSSPSLLTNATSENVKVDGLTKGLVYELSLKITTSNGIEAQRSIALVCGDI